MTTPVDEFDSFLAGLQTSLSQKLAKPVVKQAWQPKPQAETAHRVVEKPVIGRAVIGLNIVDQAGGILAQYNVRYQLIRGRSGSKSYEDCTKEIFDKYPTEPEVIESTLKVWGEV